MLTRPFATVVAAACGLLVGVAVLRRRHQSKHNGHCNSTTTPTNSKGNSDATLPQTDARTQHLSNQHAGQPRDFSRVCIVTGGSRGVGAAVCKRLAVDGYAVAVNFVVNKNQADEVVANITSTGGRAMAVQANVSKEIDVVRMFDEVEAEFGVVTACVNNAGIIGPFDGLLALHTADVAAVMATNLYGPFYVLREAARRMSTVGGYTKGGKGGAIVNVSAGSAFTGSPLAYAMSKGALNSLTASSARELVSHGIRVNTVTPGPTYTDMMTGFSQTDIDAMAAAIPMKRAGDACEVAAGIAWLLSDDASFVVDANLRIAGGKSLFE